MLCIKEMMHENLVLLDIEAEGKYDALRNIASRLQRQGVIPENAEKEFYLRLEKKEMQSSTAVGNGIAIPHVYFEAVPKPVIVFVRFARPIDYNAPDGEPVDKIFLLMGPKRDNTEYLRILARLAHLFKDNDFHRKLSEALSAEAVLNAVGGVECRH